MELYVRPKETEDYLEKPILKEDELTLLRDFKKKKGQLKSIYSSGETYKQKCIRVQRILEKLKKELGSFRKIGKWLRAHNVNVGKDWIIKYYYLSRPYLEMERKINNSVSRGEIDSEDADFLKRLLYRPFSSTSQKTKHFLPLFWEILETSVRSEIAISEDLKARLKKMKEGAVTEEEEKLEALFPEGKELIKESYSEEQQKIVSMDKDAKGNPLSKEGKRIRDLLEKYSP